MREREEKNEDETSRDRQLDGGRCFALALLCCQLWLAPRPQSLDICLTASPPPPPSSSLPHLTLLSLSLSLLVVVVVVVPLLRCG